jgi:tetratricopeptide (TPR) repeat protein
MASIVRSRSLGAFLLVALAAPATLAAQRQRLTPPEGTSRFLVPTLDSKDKDIGMDAADAIRSRLRQDFSTKVLWVLSKDNVCALLEASGFKCDVMPDRITLKLLAQQLRAEEYLEGKVEKTGDGYRLESQMVLTRNNNMVQPLPVAEGSRMLDMATRFSHSFQDARKQLEPEKNCENAIRDQNYAQARKFAREGIEAYPQATLARLCLINAMVEDSASADSILVIVQQVLQIDPDSRLALLYSARQLAAQGQDSTAVDRYVQLLSLDPTNVPLQTEAVNFLATSGNARGAIPIIDKAVENNPGDPSLLRLQFLIYLSVREWKKAIASGENLLATDTSATDTLFFSRLAIAYITDSLPQKAAEITARGVAKFPQNAGLWSLHARMLRSAGQVQQSIEAASRSLSISPNNGAAWLALADALVEVNQSDSAVSALRSAVQYSDSAAKSNIAQRLLIIGNQNYKAADSLNTKAKQPMESRQTYLKAIGILALADTIATEPAVTALLGQSAIQIKFLMGVSQYQVAANATQEFQEKPSCDLAKFIANMLLQSRLNTSAGGRFDPQNAGVIMNGISQLSPYIDQQVQALCK